jgi:hypothetical protein
VMAEYEESGQSRRAFCEQRNMALTTFDYWRREMAAKPAKRTKLVAVRVAEPECRFALVLGNGRRIECASETDLARLIRVAERA